MNDRFRFRAIDNRDWADEDEKGKIYYDVQDAYDYGGGEPEVPASSFGCIVDGKGWIVEQCIGLKDSNGKLIYEGDIILSNMEYGGTHFVIVGDVRGYCYDAVAVEEYEQYLKSNKSDLCFRLSSTAYHIITDHGSCFVVGNIHENPELLEDK